MLPIVPRDWQRLGCVGWSDESVQKGRTFREFQEKGEETVMKKNRSFSLVKNLALFAAALCWSASLARAQSAAKGEFTLPLA